VPCSIFDLREALWGQAKKNVPENGIFMFYALNGSFFLAASDGEKAFLEPVLVL
jgi:hypothetical protein